MWGCMECKRKQASKRLFNLTCICGELVCLFILALSRTQAQAPVTSCGMVLVLLFTHMVVWLVCANWRGLIGLPINTLPRWYTSTNQITQKQKKTRYFGYCAQIANLISRFLDPQRRCKLGDSISGLIPAVILTLHAALFCSARIFWSGVTFSMQHHLLQVHNKRGCQEVRGGFLWPLLNRFAIPSEGDVDPPF